MRLLVLLICVHGILCQHHPNNVPGTTAIVHLFEWRYQDIAAECERFLGPKGYAGLQVSPVTENAYVMQNPETRPWWERYQVVSYSNFQTRSGNEQELKEMVSRCNKAGVRVYVDVVINHMTGTYSGTGTGGTSFDGNNKNFPGGPFSSWDFNGRDTCPSGSGQIENYGDATQVRNCELVGLRDLNQSKDYVRQQIAGLLNKLISYGVAGFRVDAAKHMWPGDLRAIFNMLSDLSTDHGFGPGSRPFIYQEVIDNGGEAVTAGEYTGNGRVTEFKYSSNLGAVFRRKNPMKYLSNWGEGWGLISSGYGLAFIDNHDNQRTGSADILTFRDARAYKMAIAFMCAHPYGFVRIMSSYYWDQNWQNGKDQNDWIGPPHDGNFNTLNVPINPDDTCGNGWMCEHRWRQIYNMVGFRNTVDGQPLANWWSGSDYQIAFSRGNRGFIAINNEGFDLSATLQTGLPGGNYCDIISGNLENGRCTGKTITVNGDGTVNLYISGSDEDPMVAMHVNMKL